MKTQGALPKTLIEAVRYFSDQDVCRGFVAALRWPQGPVCPACGVVEPLFLQTRKLWKCRACKKQFSVKVGTIFEDSPIGLDKWLPALWMIVNAKNGVSSYEIARSLGVTQKTAWFMMHRIRLAMQTGTFRKMGGDVEIDETFIGGKARYMHKIDRARKIKGTGGMGKAAVMGLLERHGPDGHSRVVLKHVPNVRRHHLAPEIIQHVEPGSEVFTDKLRSYDKIGQDYIHKVIDHAESYAEGKVHTNGLENFWSLLKRSVKGTYVSVEPFHLFRYLDEQALRFNTRKIKDAERFVRVLTSIVGKRLTYQHLIGAEATT
ncbi:MAG TPA: IS1595 family transposase [bacterium]|nr:IS1595 family transposase [bacterium]